MNAPNVPLAAAEQVNRRFIDSTAVTLNTIDAYIGLGSNRAYHVPHAGALPKVVVQAAIESIHALPNVSCVAQSALYQSKALVKPNQPPEADYINAVIKVQTSLSAWQLLTQLQAIETRFGRDRNQEIRWGARSLDLDILLYGQQCIHAQSLKIPHVELVNRAFVLYPLHDIDAELDVPNYGKLSELIEQLNTPLDTADAPLERIT